MCVSLFEGKTVFYSDIDNIAHPIYNYNDVDNVETYSNISTSARRVERMIALNKLFNIAEYFNIGKNYVDLRYFIYKMSNGEYDVSCKSVHYGIPFLKNVKMLNM